MAKICLDELEFPQLNVLIDKLTSLDEANNDSLWLLQMIVEKAEKPNHLSDQKNQQIIEFIYKCNFFHKSIYTKVAKLLASLLKTQVVYPEKLVSDCFQVIETESDKSSNSCASSLFSFDYALNLLKPLILHDEKIQQRAFNVALKLLTDCEEDQLLSIITCFLLPTLQVNTDTVSFCLGSIWRIIIQMSKIEFLFPRTFTILCWMIELFLTVKMQSEDCPNASGYIIQLDSFWLILQQGLCCKNNLTRKHCIYLLNHIVDFCEKLDSPAEICGSTFIWLTGQSEALANAWNEFQLLYETLEEKQFHVIKPVLEKFDSIVKVCTNLSVKNRLHHSWMSVIVLRSSGHDSQRVKRWAATSVLAMKSCDLEVLLPAGWDEFLSGPFVQVLNETSIYLSSPEQSPQAVSPIVQLLPSYLDDCCVILGKLSLSDDFMLRFLCSVRGLSLNSYAFTFLVHCLAKTSHRWKQTAFAECREILTACSRTIDTHMKAAIATFISIMVSTKLAVEFVNPREWLTMLGWLLNHEEASLVSPPLWDDISSWMQEVATLWPDWSKVELIGVLKAGWQAVKAVSSREDQERHCRAWCGMLSLLVKAKIVTVDESAALLSPACEIVVTANKRAYLSATTANAALLLLTENCRITMKLGCHYPAYELNRNSLAAVVMPALEWIFSKVELLKSLAAVKDFAADCLAVETLLLLCPQQSLVSSQVREFLEKCMMTLGIGVHGPDLGYSDINCYATVGACFLLAAMRSQLTCKHTEYVEFAGSWIIHQQLPQLSQACGSSEGVGPVISQFVAAQWRLLHPFYSSGRVCSEKVHSLETVSREEVSLVVVRSVLESIDLQTEEVVVPVLNCIALVLPKVSESNIISCLKIVFSLLSHGLRRPLFWENFKAFLSLLIQTRTLEFEDKCGAICQLACQIVELSAEKHGMANLLSQRLCLHFRAKPQDLHLAVKLLPCIVQILHFGALNSKNQRYFLETQNFLYSLGDQLPVNNTIKRECHEDRFVRAWMYGFVCCLAGPSRFTDELVKQLIAAHKLLVVDRTARSFHNSLSHRLKHRNLTALLLCQRFIVSPELAAVALDFLNSVLAAEGQPSIRSQAEWLFVLLLHRFPDERSRVVEGMKQDAVERGSLLCSHLTILAHLSATVGEPGQLEKLLEEVIPLVIPWSTSHHFNTRLFAQACLHIVWSHAKGLQLTIILEKFSLVECLLSLDSLIGGQAKSTRKLLSSYFFTFHALKDFSLETVLETIPRLTSMSSEEWICVSDMRQVLSFGATSSAIPLHNSRDALSNCTPGAWRIKPAGQDELPTSAAGDVQKKIIPWKCMFPDEQHTEDEIEETATRNTGNGNLVVVTSLITKAPNLGGLCRTCEIFGASEFVVNSLQYLHSQSFKSLSVTAESWLPIKEVKSYYLASYLASMRSDGYTLVGAEQTAGSSCLTKYNFSEKTLLLLGNEKEGIPVELIQLLDVCLEIPQQGLIRSLNVHVSGALLIWEYRRQQLLKKPAVKSN